MYGNLVSYYNFNNNSSSTLYHIKESTNGTLVNNITWVKSVGPIGNAPTQAASVSDGASKTLNMATSAGYGNNFDVAGSDLKPQAGVAYIVKLSSDCFGSSALPTASNFTYNQL